MERFGINTEQYMAHEAKSANLLQLRKEPKNKPGVGFTITVTKRLHRKNENYVWHTTRQRQQLIELTTNTDQWRSIPVHTDCERRGHVEHETPVGSCHIDVLLTLLDVVKLCLGTDWRTWTGWRKMFVTYSKQAVEGVILESGLPAAIFHQLSTTWSLKSMP